MRLKVSEFGCLDVSSLQGLLPASGVSSLL